MNLCYLVTFPGLAVPSTNKSGSSEEYDYKPCERGGILSLLSKDVCENLIITVHDRHVTDIECYSGLPERCHDAGYLSQYDRVQRNTHDNYSAVAVAKGTALSSDTGALTTAAEQYFGIRGVNYPDGHWVLQRAVQIAEPLFNRYFYLSQENQDILQVKVTHISYSVESIGSLNCAVATIAISAHGSIFAGTSGCKTTFGNVIVSEVVGRLKRERGEASVRVYANSLYSIAVNRALLNGFMKLYGSSKLN